MNAESGQPGKPTVRRGRYVFEISSRTRVGQTYLVDVLYLRCTCQAATHGLRCWHLTWAIQAEFWLNRAAEEAPLTENASVRPVGGQSTLPPP